MAVKFDRSVAELDQFKKQFLSKATEKTVSSSWDIYLIILIPFSFRLLHTYARYVMASRRNAERNHTRTSCQIHCSSRTCTSPRTLSP